MGNSKSKLTELVDLYVEEDGGPMTASSVGSLGQTENDLFTVPKSVSYPEHKEPATSKKRKKKFINNFDLTKTNNVIFKKKRW